MGLTVRDWMVIVGSLLILAVIIDAARRMAQEKRDRIRVNANPLDAADDSGKEDDGLPSHEFPSGGARVFRREDVIEAQRHHDAELAASSQQQAHQQPVEDGTGEPSATSTPGPGGRGSRQRKDPDPTADPLDGVRPDRTEPANLDWLEDLPQDVPEPDEEDSGGELPRHEDMEVIMLHVLSRDPEGFRGKDILEILLACDLRFGDMDFFHRHEREAGRGPIQFSVANMLQPGVFDIDNMDTLRTRGLLFFLTLPGPEDMQQAFDFMLETARTVARNLDGDLLDDARSALTEQSIDHARQQIRDLERRLLAHSG